jgi:hypothetical protein
MKILNRTFDQSHPHFWRLLGGAAGGGGRSPRLGSTALRSERSEQSGDRGRRSLPAPVAAHQGRTLKYWLCNRATKVLDIIV